MHFCRLPFFSSSKLRFPQLYFRNTIKMSNSLDFVEADLIPNFLISEDDKLASPSMQRVKNYILCLSCQNIYLWKL